MDWANDAEQLEKISTLKKNVSQENDIRTNRIALCQTANEYKTEMEKNDETNTDEEKSDESELTPLIT